ncbi:hypothetical protein LTR37_005526 [Vermiconidia calcicola]|uniref:Uncharacterized protein n=1 Tax=Vermiconidia calcicola TaxID=1690605 RepID=A0ACC3NIN1_9PEZI|nr:hypothetical protein LTR37_005526 [Vermiconidia calcicola]
MALIEELLQLQVPRDVKISPNSQQVLYSTNTPLSKYTGDLEVYPLWLAETGHAKSSRQLTSGLYRDHAPRWCPDGNSIAFISDRAKQSEQWAIYMLPTKAGGEAYPVTPAGNERSIGKFEFDSTGNTIAFLSADEKSPDKKAKEEDKDDAKVWGEDWPYNRLRLVHVATKKVTTLVSRDAHILDFAWNDDGTKIAYIETKSPDIESPMLYGTKISVLDIISRDVREVCSFPASLDSLVWVEDSLYVLGPVNTESTVSAKMVRVIELNAEQPKCEPYAHGQHDCASELGRAGKDVTVLVQHGMEDQIRMLKGRTLFSEKKEIAGWDASFTTDSDEMVLAIVISDTNTPWEVYTTTASGGAMVQLSNHGHTFAEQKFASVHFLKCRSRDDKEELDAIYLIPSAHADSNAAPTKSMPTIVNIHGGPYMRVTDEFNPSYFMCTQVLLDAGYGMFFPNYRGSSGRGQTFAAYDRGACGTYDYEDIITLTQYAIEQGYADKDRLIARGWSQGGFLSFMCTVRNGLHKHGWKFKATIPGAGVSDGDTMALTSDIGAFQGDLAGKPPWGCDKDDTSGRTGSAIWEFAAAVKKGGVIPPILILHGENDARVPLEQAVGFRRAMESAKLPFEMVVYPREPHLIRERKHLIDMTERTLKFVDLHIGGKRIL